MSAIKAALLRVTLSFILPALLSACAGHGGRPEKPRLPPVVATDVQNKAALEKLRGNTGMTLQWISWDYRGAVTASQPAKVLHLSGSQSGRDGMAGKLTLDGDVVRISHDRFTLRGRIVIDDAPDKGRHCVREGDFTFLITQNRKYWRLQDMERCDGLTDYVDIYF